ncbi:MAG: DUF3768 domain-containing protein [Moraxellaceae bacterium]|nr:DUF3768 domain-containing protein [Pseudobdellovibrionaceae bacterium]
MLDTAKATVAAIAAKNDELRKCLPNPLPFPHQALLTDEIEALPEDKIRLVLFMVREFYDFTESNDPHSEHDFGEIDFEGQKIFWKFDYYNEDMEHFEENGRRVLLVMYAHEY